MNLCEAIRASDTGEAIVSFQLHMPGGGTLTQYRVAHLVADNLLSTSNWELCLSIYDIFSGTELCV